MKCPPEAPTAVLSFAKPVGQSAASDAASYRVAVTESRVEGARSVMALVPGYRPQGKLPNRAIEIAKVSAGDGVAATYGSPASDCWEQAHESVSPSRRAEPQITTALIGKSAIRPVPGPGTCPQIPVFGRTAPLSVPESS